jgi:carbon storage regulator CsrA
MLVLSRRLNERILLPTVPAAVQVVSIKPGVVRLGIDAPSQVPVLREELRPQPQGPPPNGAAEAQGLGEGLAAAAARLALLRRQLGPALSPAAAETLRHLEADLQALQRRAAPPQPAARKARTALVVEDNANERELLAHFLRGAGLEVSTAGDGLDALDYLRSRPRPDVVLLDMAMPRCDGPTAVRAIRRDPCYAGLKIVAVSGHRPDEYDLGVGPAGVDRWFRKPIDPRELLRDVIRELEAGRP